MRQVMPRIQRVVMGSGFMWPALDASSIDESGVMMMPVCVCGVCVCVCVCVCARARACACTCVSVRLTVRACVFIISVSVCITWCKGHAKTSKGRARKVIWLDLPIQVLAETLYVCVYAHLCM